MSPQAAHAFKRFPSSGEDVFRSEVFAGLSAHPRSLSPRWFYDQRGSELFEEITALPEYYVTRAEYNILLHHATEVARITGSGRALIERITARFNLNLIHRINRELRGAMPVDAFRHVALWNDCEFWDQPQLVCFVIARRYRTLDPGVIAGKYRCGE
jgi:uncharacterized SAM-dependent methyltransferase